MECLSPLSIPRQGGSGAADRQTVPCGKCMACLQTKRSHWTFRLNEQLRNSSSAYFVTLTYENNKVPLSENLIPEVSKRDVQLFIKRLRKRTKSQIRYYLVSEYGSTTHRPHYHAIMFNVDPVYSKATEMIFQEWQNGQIMVGTVTPASIHYVTKYAITKTDYPSEVEKPFALMSKGLGKSYIERCRSYHDGNLDRSYTRSENGHIGSLPRYYLEKLYSKEEREQIAVNRSKMRKSPEEMYPNSKENPFKRLADQKEYFASETLKTTKSKKV